ncbi:hypothetical protein [Streptomyces sp. Mg1]|uniref:hypothetical protein n=1 Tax=Streptomyces sp. Mg1 TaxID=465541 RepID=UPI00017E7FDC|nr:hypothetical protein [Streptomyces sp. Mg1]AKL71028.1 hypothetical protein M444_37245 [Streptomyces sp. Mg1]EDX22843.1 hypothetical protein SSAG_02634 [Streptomyces sp. Mg1]
MKFDFSAVPAIPEDRAFTVDQLTPQDYAGVCAFLADRLRELEDSGQAAAALALGMALAVQTDTLGPNFQWEDDYPHEPVPGNWLSERMHAWNHLVCVLWAGWQDAEGYDRIRWTLVSSPRPEPATAEAS